MATLYRLSLLPLCFVDDLCKPTPMDNTGTVDKVDSLTPQDQATWGGIEQNTQDPEEVRVIFSALDSFS